MRDGGFRLSFLQTFFLAGLSHPLLDLRPAARPPTDSYPQRKVHGRSVRDQIFSIPRNDIDI